MKRHLIGLLVFAALLTLYGVIGESDRKTALDAQYGAAMVLRDVAGGDW